MYKDLTSEEGKYFLYLIDNISSIEKKFNDTLKNRDFRLKLVLYKEYDSFKNTFEEKLKEIKKSVDNLDLKNLNIKELEEISIAINSLINYFEKITESKYVVDNC